MADERIDPETAPSGQIRALPYLMTAIRLSVVELFDVSSLINRRRCWEAALRALMRAEPL